MADYRLSLSAENQIYEILEWSERQFGEMTRDRYAALLVTAMEDVANSPHRKSVRWKRVISGKVGVYHLRHSRENVSYLRGAIGEPRHYLIFRIGGDGIVDILGFVHDSMLFDRAFRRVLSSG